jgi:predicted GNAT family acetyltransferase
MNTLKYYLEQAIDYKIIEKDHIIFCGTDKKGYLEYDQEDNDYFLVMVEVKEEFKNQGIATKLLKYFLNKVNEEKGVLDISGYLPEGEKYLKNKIELMKKDYPNIEWI